MIDLKYYMFSQNQALYGNISKWSLQCTKWLPANGGKHRLHRLSVLRLSGEGQVWSVKVFQSRYAGCRCYITVVMPPMAQVCSHCVRVAAMYHGGMEISSNLFIFTGSKHVLIQVQVSAN